MAKTNPYYDDSYDADRYETKGMPKLDCYWKFDEDYTGRMVVKQPLAVIKGREQVIPDTPDMAGLLDAAGLSDLDSQKHYMEMLLTDINDWVDQQGGPEDQHSIADRYSFVWDFRVKFPEEVAEDRFDWPEDEIFHGWENQEELQKATELPSDEPGGHGEQYHGSPMPHIGLQELYSKYLLVCPSSGDLVKLDSECMMDRYTPLACLEHMQSRVSQSYDKLMEGVSLQEQHAQDTKLVTKQEWYQSMEQHLDDIAYVKRNVGYEGRPEFNNTSTVDMQAAQYAVGGRDHGARIHLFSDKEQVAGYESEVRQLAAAEREAEKSGQKPYGAYQFERDGKKVVVPFYTKAAMLEYGPSSVNAMTNTKSLLVHVPGVSTEEKYEVFAAVRESKGQPALDKDQWVANYDKQVAAKVKSASLARDVSDMVRESPNGSGLEQSGPEL